MALYPSLSIVPYASIEESTMQKVLKTNFEELGKEQRKRKWLYQKRIVTLNYVNIDNDELSTLLEFEKARYGEYNSFTFIYPTYYSDITYSNEYAGTGDGSETVFNMPCVSSSRTVYVDGNEQTEAADATSAGNYYIDEGDGQDGVDSLIFFVAPNDGERITCDFTGQLAIRCRFSGNISNSRRYIGRGFNNVTVTLQGLLIDE